mmetsp:Transcript_2407/g.5103  ORF Transcript_2407/g.5103 Transcript_2407/m.5103 type:complete len:238 (-) Transcript_2407:304-1017(-)
MRLSTFHPRQIRWKSRGLDKYAGSTRTSKSLSLVVDVEASLFWDAPRTRVRCRLTVPTDSGLTSATRTCFVCTVRIHRIGNVSNANPSSIARRDVRMRRHPLTTEQRCRGVKRYSLRNASASTSGMMVGDVDPSSTFSNIRLRRVSASGRSGVRASPISSASQPRTEVTARAGCEKGASVRNAFARITWSRRFLPTPRHTLPGALSSSVSPMPEARSRAGVRTAPPHKMTCLPRMAK